MKQYKKIDHQLISINSRSLEQHENHSPHSNNSANKGSSGSLNKYNKSPYLQSIIYVKEEFTQGFVLPKKPSQLVGINNIQTNSRVKQTEAYVSSPSKSIDKMQQKSSLFKRADNYSYETEKKQNPRSKSNLTASSEQKQKTLKFKLPKLDMEYIKTDKKQSNSASQLEYSNNTLSATLEVTTKKKKLIPITQTFRSQAVVKTKAGTNGNQTKINQDIAIVQTSFAHGVRLYCVCDGHGLNGHLVSAFIKQNLIKNLNLALKKFPTQPPKIQQVFQECLAHTNDALLNSDINTQLSGSTVIAVFIHKQTIYSFNIGDSRAILVSEQKNHTHRVIPLSDDQKPSRQDQKQRILKFGGRVEAQKNEKGQILGPLRVWMKDVQMPGLAMTRSFGDKAGIKAGTHAEPELTIHKITSQDKFMVIASDGVWEYLQNQEVMNIILPFYKKNDIDMAAEKILRISMEIWHKISYSRDDITVVIVSLNPPQPEISGQNQKNAYLSLPKYTEIQE